MHGGLGLQKDMQRAVKLWTEAAELGSIEEALYVLGDAYYFGTDVQEDKVKGIQFRSKAAMHARTRQE